MRWGLVPFWAKDIKVGFSNINAKAETVDARPAFREAFTRRRCLVPFDCFYEWKKVGKDREPYAVALVDRRLMGMAGLLGNLAFSGGREGAQLCDRYDRPKCSARRAA